MLMHEMMMSANEAIDLLLEADQLSETEIFLLEAMQMDDAMAPGLLTRACAVYRKVQLMQVAPLTDSLH